MKRNKRHRNFTASSVVLGVFYLLVRISRLAKKCTQVLYLRYINAMRSGRLKHTVEKHCNEKSIVNCFHCKCKNVPLVNNCDT